MQLEVSEDAPGGHEGAGHAGQDLPAAQVAGAAGLRRPRGLLDELAVDLVPQRPQLLARLQDALDDGHRVGHALQVLQGVEHLQGLLLQRCAAPVPSHWERKRENSEGNVKVKVKGQLWESFCSFFFL